VGRRRNSAFLEWGGSAFTWQMFMSGAILNAIPGIIIHLVLIPAIMVALNRTGLVKFRRIKPVAEEADMIQQIAEMILCEIRLFH
jgi:hypothetical protein